MTFRCIYSEGIRHKKFKKLKFISKLTVSGALYALVPTNLLVLSCRPSTNLQHSSSELKFIGTSGFLNCCAILLTTSDLTAALPGSNCTTDKPKSAMQSWGVVVSSSSMSRFPGLISLWITSRCSWR